MACDISQVFTTIVSSLQHTTCKNVSSEKNADKTTSKTPPSPSTASPDYEFSFQSRAKSLHSSLQVLSNYLKRIHQLTSGTLGNVIKQRLHSELTEHANLLIDQCTVLLTQLKDLIPIHNSNDDHNNNRSKTIKESAAAAAANSKSQLISHRLTVHKLLSEELDYLKKIRAEELNRQQRLVEFSGNLAAGVRSVTAAAAGSTDTNISAYLKSTSSNLDDTTVLRRRRGHQQENVGISQQQQQQQEQKASQQHRHDHGDGDEDTNFTDTELHTLKIENDVLFEHLIREKDEIHQVAKKISEIGYLNQTLTEHLSEQLEVYVFIEFNFSVDID
ncbi:unnamed protein product [Trichobilharzia regenti]|nr:unnamed protein product [Trichobilharzia regenti]